MPYKKELVIIGFLIGLVVIVAISILSTKKFMFRDFSIMNPTNTDSYFDINTLNDASNIYITTFTANGNIEPMSLAEVLLRVQKSQRFLMDKVNELVDAKLANYVRKHENLSLIFPDTDKAVQLDPSWQALKASAGGPGNLVKLTNPRTPGNPLYLQGA